MEASPEIVEEGTFDPAEYAELDYDESKQLHELPPLYVDRITYPVPYGTDGEVELRLDASRAMQKTVETRVRLKGSKG